MSSSGIALAPYKGAGALCVDVAERREDVLDFRARLDYVEDSDGVLISRLGLEEHGGQGLASGIK